MSYASLQYQIDASVAWVTLTRPESFNALDAVMSRELLDVANRCGSDPAVRAVVITGEGDRAFCAGGDIPSFAERLEDIDLLVKEMTTSLHAAVSRFARLQAPVIAAINGVAAGAGFSLVTCCDLAIAAEEATFTSAYTRIGLTPDGGSTHYLARLVGQRRAMELFLTNRVLSAAEALDWGLVNRVVPAAQLVEEARTLAQDLAAGPTAAHGGIKGLLRCAATENLETQMEHETQSIAAAGRSPDGREGIRAFIDKRPPRFTGKTTG